VEPRGNVGERVVLIAAVAVLFGGLGVWALVAGRDQADETLLLMRPEAPPIGAPVRADAPAAAVDRAVLERAMLGGTPIVRMLSRAGTPVHGIVVPGRDAIAVRDRIAAEGLATGRIATDGSAAAGNAAAGSAAAGNAAVGNAAERRARWPVVLGDGWSVQVHAEAAATTSDPPDAILRRAGTVELDRWIERRLAASPPADGTWPEQIPQAHERFAVVRDPVLDLPLPEIAIALLPARAAAEVPAWLAFGNWQGCPEPTIHTALLARWNERFGAEIIAVSADTIEMRVARPPSDRETALALAREHVAYAPGIVGGGMRTLADIAASRVGAGIWTFRWPRTTRPR
jgi:hypothetical protein